MSELSKSNHSASKVSRARGSYQALLWLTRLGVVGSVGLLSSGMIWSHIPPDPTSQEAMAASIEPAQPSPAQEAAPVRVLEPQIPIQPQAAEPPAPVEPAALAPAPITPTAPVNETPQIQITNAASPAPSPAGNVPTPGNAYIDSTNYNLGATKYEAPTSIVLTERSSGCQTVLQGNQSPNGACGGGAPTQRVVPGESPRQAEAPAWTKGTPIPMPIAVPENSLRSRSYPVAAYSTVKPGFSLVPVTPLDSSTNYYSRTARPVGIPGNGNINLLFPLSIPAPITSLFGWRVHPITGDMRFHDGTDLGAPMGTPVVAALSGQVVTADFAGGYGLTVVLDHNKTQQQTLYGHLSEIFVRPGEWVNQGTVIGRVGSTGNSTGPHLHFELRQLTPEGWVAVNADSLVEMALAQLQDSLQYTIVQVAELGLPEDLISLNPDAEAGFEAVLENRGPLGEVEAAVLPDAIPTAEIPQTLPRLDLLTAFANEVESKTAASEVSVEVEVAHRKTASPDFEATFAQLIKVLQASTQEGLAVDSAVNNTTGQPTQSTNP